jgi:hypothetical protein
MDLTGADLEQCNLHPLRTLLEGARAYDLVWVHGLPDPRCGIS